MPHVNIFVSTVTAEFRAYRDVLVKRLTRHNVSVKVQEDFIAGGGTLLLKLDDYIRHSDAVIHLAGDATGAAAHPIDVEDLVKRYPDLGTRLRGEINVEPNAGLSYTQWEAYLAIYHGKMLIIACPKPIAERDPGFATKSDEQAAQQEHLKRLECLARYPNVRFSDVKDLLAYVLHSDINQLLPKDEKPIVLPYISLGNLFKGRDAFVEELHTSLHAPRSATAIVGKAVHGLGGTGKTRLAVEYAWRHAEHYTAVLFAQSESLSDLQKNLAALAGPNALDLPEQDVTEEPVKTAAVVKWLKTHPGWLLILDNVDTKDAAVAVERFLKDMHHGHALITARFNEFSGGIEMKELDVLAPADATAFLLERTHAKRRKPTTDLADAEELARDLGGLALALEHAGAYISVRRISFREYLNAWHAHDAKLLDYHDKDVMGYRWKLAKTFETTLNELGPGEVALIRILAWFGPEPIPEFIFEHAGAEEVWREQAKSLAATSPATNHPIETLRDTAITLANYSMLQRDADTGALTMHRVLQELQRASIPEGERNIWITATMYTVYAASPADAGDVRTWSQWDPLRPHAESIASHGDDAGIAIPTWGLMGQLDVLLSAKALYVEAERYSRRALEICGLYHQGKDHPEMASRLNNLAQLLKDTNRLADAEPLMRRALEIDERSFGPEHPNVAIELNNLALLLQSTNRVADAEPLMRRALKIDENCFGPEHPNVAIDLNNLARMLQDTNRLADAEPLMRRALRIFQTCLGPEHPNVSILQNNLAQLLNDTNRLADAEPLMRRALEIDEKSYGPEHPNVAIRLNNLARLLQDTNRLAEAEPLMRRHVIIFLKFTKNTGHKHPHLRAAFGNYGGLLQAMGRTEAEIRAELRALLDEHGVRLT